MKVVELHDPETVYIDLVIQQQCSEFPSRVHAFYRGKSFEFNNINRDKSMENVLRDPTVHICSNMHSEHLADAQRVLDAVNEYFISKFNSNQQEA